MATKVKVELSKGEGFLFPNPYEFANIELSGQTNYTYGNGSNEFSVGLHGSNIHMLTVYKKTPGTVKITPLDGDVNVSVDRGKDKKLSKGKSLTLSSKAKSILVRERA